MEEEEREPSVASSSDLYSESDTPAAVQHHGPTPTKRKAEHSDSGPDKKRKLDPVSSSPSSSRLLPCVGLPPEIWQNVFLSCSPATLGRLLQVNRSFRSYLLDVQSPSSGAGRLSLVRSDSIWIAARKAHPTRPSKPPEGFSEVDLWSLIMGKSCQFCQSTPSSMPGEKAWEKGPGPNGVRIIWPFWVRACGSCLNERCEKDTTLLFSAASALRPALPFAFITSDLNVIAASSLQDPALPPSLQISKVYYKPQIQEMEAELVEAQSRGSAAAEEWLKGLESRGRARMSNSAGWEKWEIKYQWWLKHQDTRRTPMSTSTSPGPSLPQKTASPFRAAVSSRPSNGTPVATTSTQLLPPRPAVSAQPMHAPQHISQPPLHHPRPERNIHDANEAKAARKADIERRCEALSPPIPANVLRHMESFKAAIQISQPMTDNSWEVLKPRLLAQRADAEKAEGEQAARMAYLQTRVADRRQQDASNKEVKEVLDREWEDSQKPVRDRLSSYADEFIRFKWAGDKSINYDSSPKFAAELLLHVRQKFYSDVSGEDRTADDAPGMDLDQPDQLPRRALILENMKWTYDNKIKPLTEQYRKELFLCNGCDGNFRYYGFEGVIQHYGAKHTSAFSVGNVVVSWREAEWPEEPPFHPDPSAAKSYGHSVPTSMPAHGHSAYAPYYGGYSRGGTTTPQMSIHLQSPSPYMPYGAQFNGPFPPPPPPSNPVHGANYNYSQGYAQPQPMDPYNGYQLGYLGYSTSPLMNASVPVGNGSNGFGFQTSPQHVPVAPAPMPQEPDKDEPFRTTLFDEQVRSLVEMARDIWNSTSGIKDLPNSVRVYVLLQRVISKFQLQFDHEPTLDHFSDAVQNHSLSGLKSAAGLACKACQSEPINQFSMSNVSRPEDRKTYHVLSLFSHFKSVHLERFGPRPTFQNGQQLRLLDWKEDMIELPSDRSISGLIHAPGMDDDKLHIIATVFPTLFPTPLPRIGVVDQSGVASASLNRPKSAKLDTDMPDALDEGLGTTPRKSLHGRANLPRRPGEEEYDPLRPALVRDSRHAVGASHRRPSHSWSPPSDDRRQVYYAEPRYIRPRDPMDDEYAGPPPRQYIEVSPNGTRYLRDASPMYEEIRERRPVYRDREVYPSLPPGESRGYYRGPSQLGATEGPPGMDRYRYGPESARARSRSESPARAETDAERFLNEFVPPPPLPQHIRKDEGDLRQPWPPKDNDDGSKYTPPPPILVAPADDRPDPNTPSGPQPIPINGSLHYEDSRHGRHTPDSGHTPRRPGPGPYRRREVPVPSRYARYMSAADRDTYARGHSIQRSHSRYERRYERYDQQRRRLDQEGETPGPPTAAERDRDRSLDRYTDERDHDPYYHPLRQGSREYVPIDDHRGAGPPPARYFSRFAAETADAQPPQFVDEFGEPVQYVRVRSEAYQPRYADDRERVEYVPVGYDQRERERDREYVYYDERAPVPLRGGEVGVERVPVPVPAPVPVPVPVAFEGEVGEER
ncbi:uncharacterized protein BDZ99DRAFT_466387 [Mytilinidion resinicola]|uniref:DUF7892 domain-containing protein n=1 Tax=Mytilinidion resinicola TaxID=574789 RepID=A0A6A6YC72_9PEZI|nr:uncharacterized protein BDZ99DRAFT_466387 [Mytilinidion resinicola]KAF2806113.1 hypothetical protein BDZ99DRAFT_466387 [Mytilinidion resinicola]